MKISRANRRLRNRKHAIQEEGEMTLEPGGVLDTLFNNLDVRKVVFHMKDGTTASYEARP